MTTNRPYFEQDKAVQYLADEWNLPMRVSTLRTKRTDGSGPRYTRSGRTPLYHPDDLDTWAQSQPRFRAVIEEPASETQKAAAAG